MADVFVSYARADKARVAPLVAVLVARGWSVWWDPEIAPGQDFDDLIEQELLAARAVLVVWTSTSVASRWVRGEARDAAERSILVPVRFEQARLPIDVRAIHTTDLDGWCGDVAHPAAQECLAALAALIAPAPTAPEGSTAERAASTAPAVEPRRCSVCVLPFVNMSGDPEQEYFSDGITEDVTTDLGKVSALGVTSSNSAFRYKGKHPDIATVARELHVTHVLEGSVRKAAGRIRINAQLIDGATNNHLWAERYDRDASNIFAIQDEISHAIVKALKLRLLPEEQQAIERRGTESAQAHDLYLMARQIYVTNQEADERSAQAIASICRRATEIDPNYAQAWALLAIGHRGLNEARGTGSGAAMQAVERALALNPKLAEAHAVKARILETDGAIAAATTEAARALELDPHSYEANRAAGRLNYMLHRYEEAIGFYETAAGLMEADINSATQLISCNAALGNTEAMRRAAELALKRTDAVLARDQNNAGVVAYSAVALAALGEGEKAKARMHRALLMDPDNFIARYNFACVINRHLHDEAAALEMLGPVFETVTATFLPYAKADPDFDSLHDDPRWLAMLAAAEARLAAAAESAPIVNQQPA